MSTQGHYRSDLRDLAFNLFEFLDVPGRTLGRGPFEELDEDAARQILDTLEKFALNELAPTFAAGDREPPVHRPDGSVVLPDHLKKAIGRFFDHEWHRLDVPTDLGGMGAPPTLRWAAFELIAGSSPAIAFYGFGAFIGTIIGRLGTPSQKQRFLPQLFDRRWGGAMVLTEPDAGSDVGSGRTKARHVDGDLWELEGTKRFITNGVYDLPENIVHLALARPEGAGPGTKGLSMFIVPTRWVEEDGSLGADNHVRCIGLEKKMGLKASVTCEISYGEAGPTRGLLVGEVHDGIRQMFQVIEHARMAVGCKSMATLSTAYLNALAYARERVQGADLLRAADKTAPRVRIIEHPDVRRMLMTQKAFAHGMRALCLWTASIQDQVEILGGHRAEAARELDRLNDLLLPLVKGYCSEKTYELLNLSLQTFGGSGYVQDHPIEQYVRDQKIDSLYEGTTHIQALDLLLRKVARDGGRTLGGLLKQVQATLAAEEGGEALAEARRGLTRAVGDVQAIFGALMTKAAESLYHVGLQGNRVLAALAEVVIGWLLVRHAAVAVDRLPTAKGDDAAFYRGKIASATWYCREVLPGLSVTRELVEGSRLDLMELPEEVF